MPAGYTKLASMMGAHPETAILRRFSSLNALNLLYLQAELTNLENALHKEAKADAESGHFDRTLCSRDWQSLRESATSEKGGSRQWELMLEVRQKLNEYNQALHLQHKIAEIGPPNKQDFEFLRKWMSLPSMGNVYLLGADSDIWETYDPGELVSLLPRASESCVAGLIDRMLARYHHFVGHLFKRPDRSEIHKETVEYSNEGVKRICAVLGTVLGSLLLVGSVVVLYSIANMEIRLATIGVFTGGFSLGLCLLTNGRMVEVFFWQHFSPEKWEAARHP
ncbi:hypothetical protein B0T25DRAFT_470168 [Lasiosphaeria hispida]|uniref:DUF6594 domain-containing protein n=1 Tax=Lasiosphaeria hispida TaxID=260671 RepID=A0AAJ0HVZ5_9PEZI|nr:hypothetical protein B0T25DRAFT_470168 [Lasiosphaeria hispida]